MVAIPATILAKEIGKRGTKVSGEFLEKKLGYNFVDLVTKLALFYIIAFLIAKYMEAIIYFQGGLSTIAGFFGIKMAQADQLPKQWVELFVDVNQQLILQHQLRVVSLILLVGIDRTTMEHQNIKKQSHIYFLKRKLNSNFGIL